jgi:hypothetical protein
MVQILQCLKLRAASSAVSHSDWLGLVITLSVSLRFASTLRHQIIAPPDSPCVKLTGLQELRGLSLSPDRKLG